MIENTIQQHEERKKRKSRGQLSKQRTDDIFAQERFYHHPQENMISVLFAPNREGKYHFVLVDQEGIVRVDSYFGTSKNQRQKFWQNQVKPFLNESVILLCQSKDAFFKLFLLEEKDEPQFFSQVQEFFPVETGEMKERLIQLLITKKEFEQLNFAGRFFNHIILTKKKQNNRMHSL